MINPGRSGIIWVQLIQDLGGGNYRVRESDAAGTLRGPVLDNVKIANPEAIGPLTFPSTKPYPAFWDHSGNLMFFFRNSGQRLSIDQWFSLRDNDVVTDQTCRIEADCDANSEERFFCRLTSPLSAALLVNNSLLFTLGGIWYDGSANQDVQVEISQLGAPAGGEDGILQCDLCRGAFDKATITWATQPAFDAALGSMRFARSFQMSTPSMLMSLTFNKNIFHLLASDLYGFRLRFSSPDISIPGLTGGIRAQMTNPFGGAFLDKNIKAFLFHPNFFT